MVTRTTGAAIKNGSRLLGAVCVLVLGVYVYVAQSGPLEIHSPNAADTYYNLLVRGFRAGQLSLKKEIPPGLAQLADPYDPFANAPYRDKPYRLHDLSYYKGHLYCYFGVTPALILFWPYAFLTGHFLFHRQAVAIFCAIGFLASTGLLFSLWRRYFAEVNVTVAAAGTLALGLATGIPALLSRSDVYEVSISCGYALTMLALVAIWCALHESERRCRWLAIASLMYGLAVAARPSLLPGAVILLIPVAQAWRERQPIWATLISATGPITFIGLGLMLYNARRFGNPFEFGQRYQLVTGIHPASVQSFSLSYLWFNFRLYFLKPAVWSPHFPFIQKLVVPPLPTGHGNVEGPFGILPNVPLVWFALAAPLALRSRSEKPNSTLRWFIIAIALLFSINITTILLYYYTCGRYEVEFLPLLLLLAVIGILASEQTLSNRPAWRRAARWIWGLLLTCSVVFNLLACVPYHVEAHDIFGVDLLEAGKVPEAIDQFDQALRLDPHNGETHFDLAFGLEQIGNHAEAIAHYQEALQLDPDQAETHYDLGVALSRAGHTPEAIVQWKEALRLNPDYPAAQNALKQPQSAQ